jgi:hypothetical protein
MVVHFCIPSYPECKGRRFMRSMSARVKVTVRFSLNKKVKLKVLEEYLKW